AGRPRSALSAGTTLADAVAEPPGVRISSTGGSGVAPGVGVGVGCWTQPASSNRTMSTASRQGLPIIVVPPPKTLAVTLVRHGVVDNAAIEQPHRAPGKGHNARVVRGENER